MCILCSKDKQQVNALSVKFTVGEFNTKLSGLICSIYKPSRLWQWFKNMPQNFWGEGGESTCLQVALLIPSPFLFLPSYAFTIY